MKALSLWQPWASAIPLGLKRFETRSWPTAHRGPVIIHAAKAQVKVAQDFWRAELTLGRLPSRLPLGAVVAVADVVSCRPTEEVKLEVTALERLYGDYSPGRWAWGLANIRPIEPFPWTGGRGLFTIPDDVVREKFGGGVYA